MKLHFDQLAAELTALPKEKLAKVKGGDGYQSSYSTYSGGNENFYGTNWGLAVSTANSGYYYYTPGSTTTTTSPYGSSWNSNLGQWSSINYGGTTTTTTSSGYWSYVPGNSNGGGSYGGGGGSTGSSTTPGVMNDPNHDLQTADTYAHTLLSGIEAAQANGTLPANTTAHDYDIYHSALQQTINEMNAMQNSGINVRIQYGTQPSTSYDLATNEVVVTVSQNAGTHQADFDVLAHEIHHVTEYLQGETSFNKVNGGAGVLADITDEMSSYQLQHTLTYGLYANTHDLSGNIISSPSGDYHVSAADVIAFGNSHNIPDYALEPQTATDIHTPGVMTTLILTDYFIYH